LKISASDEEVAKFFDGYISSKMEELSVPGAAVIVLRHGRPVLAKSYGYADVASKRPVELEKSLFRTGSASKLFTWLLVMQLVEEGELDLDKNVNSYLDFHIPDTFEKPITMRHLMTHTAGFPEHFHGLFDRDQSVPFGKRVRHNVPERVYEPGTTHAYSNYGAALAGYVVERLRERPFKRLVQERIFNPVGMRNSTVAQPVPATMRPHLVSNYEFGSEKPDEFRTTLAPVGALSSSAADMGRFLSMLARGGIGPHGRVVTSETLRRMMTLDKPLGPGLPDGTGLGFLVGEFRGVRYAGHAGNIGSTLSADVEVLPDHGLAYYYVVNSQGPNSSARAMRDDLLRQTIARFVAPQGAPVQARGPSSAQDVAGSYLSSRRIHSGPLAFSGYLATTSVEAGADGSLMIPVGSKVTRWLPAGHDRFVDKETGIPLVAVRDKNGQVQRIASSLLYPVAVFERAPLLSSVLPFLAAFAFGTIFLALLVRPISWGIQRQSREAAARAVATERPSNPTTAAQVKRWAHTCFWMIVFTLLAWATFGVVVAMNFGFLFTMPAFVRLCLGALTLLTPIFAAVILWDAALAWRDPQRGWARRLGATVLGLAVMTAAMVLYAVEATDMSTQW